MAKTRTIEDPVLGTLTHVVASLWRRPIELRFLDQQYKIPLSVYLPKHGGTPEKNQIIAYRTFVDDLAGALRAAENAVIAQYASVTGHKAPSRQEVGKAVRLEDLVLPDVRPMPTLGILFKCDWEPEHGLAVKFEDGRITEVGKQDIVL